MSFGTARDHRNSGLAAASLGSARANTRAGSLSRGNRETKNAANRSNFFGGARPSHGTKMQVENV